MVLCVWPDDFKFDLQKFRLFHPREVVIKAPPLLLLLLAAAAAAAVPFLNRATQTIVNHTIQNRTAVMFKKKRRHERDRLSLRESERGIVRGVCRRAWLFRLNHLFVLSSGTDRGVRSSRFGFA
jgi:hypothetical protein